MRSSWIILVAACALMLLELLCCRDNGRNPDLPETRGEAAVVTRVSNLINQVPGVVAEGRMNYGFSLLREAESIIESSPAEEVDSIPRRDMYMLNLYKGNIYTTYRDFRSAAICYDIALRYAGTYGDSARMLLNLSVMSSFSGDSVEALRSADRLAGLSLPDSCYKLYAHAVARAYFEKSFGNRDKSRLYFGKSLDIARRGGMDQHMQLTPVSEIYEYYNAIGNLDSVLFYLHDYKVLADKYKLPEMMADVDKGFLRAYIMLGDRDKALSTYDRYFSIVDSLYNPTDFSALNTRFKDEDMSRTNDKVNRLELSLSQQKIMFSAVIALLFVISGGYWVYRKVRQSRVRIFYLNREIARQESASLASASISTEPISAASVPDNMCDRHSRLMSSIYHVLADPAVYCDPDFCITTLADMVDSNTKYVSQAINESTGMNFRSFINSLCIKVARVRLTGTGEYSNKTIQSVSESVGFRSTSNFVIAFKKIMGVTPSAYQKLAGRDEPLLKPNNPITDLE